MTGMKTGEIRHTRRWRHEASGNRPSLIISPEWFNETGNAVIIPLTTPGPNHENWWEPQISSTNSSCLVPDIRTAPTSVLSRNATGMAAPEELEEILNAVDRLTNGREEMSDGQHNRSEVWEADLSDMRCTDSGTMTEVLLMHHNPYNQMAITMLVSTRRRRKSPLVAELLSIQGRWALISQVRAIAVELRFGNKVGAASSNEMTTVYNKLRDFLGPSTA